MPPLLPPVELDVVPPVVDVPEPPLLPLEPLVLPPVLVPVLVLDPEVPPSELPLPVPPVLLGPLDSAPPPVDVEPPVELPELPPLEVPVLLPESSTYGGAQTPSPSTHAMPSGHTWPAEQSSTHTPPPSRIDVLQRAGAGPVAGQQSQSVKHARVHTPKLAPSLRHWPSSHEPGQGS